MAVPLTADLCARAIVAAARTYGDDPVAAVGRKRHRGDRTRRCLIPAALAIVQATGCSRPRLCQILGVDYYSLSAVPNKTVTAAPWRAALDALGVDPASIPPSRFGPKAKSGSAPDQPVVDNRKPARSGTVVAPPPVGPETPPAPPAVDHTPAIREALRRRQGVQFEVVGVEADKALIGAKEPGGCVWPMGDPREPGYRSCQTPTLTGRMYCAEHLKKAGMKVAPKTVATVGRCAAPYADREAG